MYGALLQAMIVPIILAAYAVLVFWSVQADAREREGFCICGDKLREHASVRDWDSDWGDPEHRGPNYIKPGTCRKCRCRVFIAGVPAGRSISRR